MIRSIQLDMIKYKLRNGEPPIRPYPCSDIRWKNMLKQAKRQIKDELQ